MRSLFHRIGSFPSLILSHHLLVHALSIEGNTLPTSMSQNARGRRRILSTLARDMLYFSSINQGRIGSD